MTESKHTPGPWRWDGPVWAHDPNEEAPWLVAGEHDRPVLSGEIVCNEANARFIAASPKMLEALEELLANASNMANHLNAWNELHGHDPDDRYLIREFDSIEAKARAAIAEAKGEAE